MNDSEVNFLFLFILIIHIPLAMYPAPLFRKSCCHQGRPHLSEGLRADTIRRCWRGCNCLNMPLTVQPINTHLTRGDDFHAHKAL